MKLSKFFIPLILCQVAAFPLFASEPTAEEIRLQNQYIEYRLAQGEIYKVYVKMTDGVTTVQFPSKISEIAGKNISMMTSCATGSNLPRRLSRNTRGLSCWK